MESETYILQRGHYQIEVMANLDKVPPKARSSSSPGRRSVTASGFRRGPLRYCRNLSYRQARYRNDLPRGAVLTATRSLCATWHPRNNGDRMRARLGFLFGFLFVGSVAVLLAGCGDNSQLPEQASTGSNPTFPAPQKSFIPTVNIAPAKGWPDDGKAHRRRRPCGQRFRQRPRASALALRAAERRRAGRGKQRAGSARRRQGHQRLDLQARAEARRRRHAERRTASRCCATPTATAWPRRETVFLEGPAIRRSAWR